MKQLDAETKWCPMVRFAHHNAPSGGNRRIIGGVEDIKSSRCITTDCMAWRETDNEYVPQPPEYIKTPASYPAGYCGLAGKL